MKGEGERGVKAHVTRTQEKENVLREWRDVLFCTEISEMPEEHLRPDKVWSSPERPGLLVQL